MGGRPSNKEKAGLGLDEEFNVSHAELTVLLGHPGEEFQQKVGNQSQSPPQLCGLEKEMWEPSADGYS